MTADRSLPDDRRARDLYEAGDLLGAARKEAAACDRDGYDLTARMLRELADLVEDARSALRYIEQHHGRLYGVGWDRLGV